MFSRYLVWCYGASALLMGITVPLLFLYAFGEYAHDPGSLLVLLPVSLLFLAALLAGLFFIQPLVKAKAFRVSHLLIILPPALVGVLLGFLLYPGSLENRHLITAALGAAMYLFFVALLPLLLIRATAIQAANPTLGDNDSYLMRVPFMLIASGWFCAVFFLGAWGNRVGDLGFSLSFFVVLAGALFWLLARRRQREYPVSARLFYLVWVAVGYVLPLLVIVSTNSVNNYAWFAFLAATLGGLMLIMPLRHKTRDLGARLAPEA